MEKIAMADKVTSLAHLATARANRPLLDRMRGSYAWDWAQVLGRHLLLLPLTLLFIFPWYWMITTSLKSPEQILQFPPQWIPDPISFRAYPEAFADAQMLLYGRNTL